MYDVSDDWREYDVTTTGLDGSYSFDGLLPGTYKAVETDDRVYPDDPGGAVTWEQTFGPTEASPEPFEVENECDDAVGSACIGVSETFDFGNRRLDVEKVFDLDYEGGFPAVIDGLWVEYEVREPGESTQTVDPVDLDDSDGTSAGTDYPVGTTIGEVRWYATYSDGTWEEDVLLGTTSGEVLSEDTTNTFNYDASLKAWKYEDPDGDGDYELTAGLTDWEITLLREFETDEGSEWVTYTVEPTEDGEAAFAGVLPGTYTAVETLQDDWIQTYGPEAPGDVTVVAYDGYHGQSDFVFANRQLFTKTFELDFEGDVPAGTTFWASVRTSQPGDGDVDTMTIPLTDEDEDGEYTNEVTLPDGTQVLSVEWMATWRGDDITLGTTTYIEEFMYEDLVNRFTYSGAADGTKYEDLDGDGWDQADPSVPDWQIHLYRYDGSSWVTYAVTWTSDGSGAGHPGEYTFTGLLPGTYSVLEGDRPGWIQTDGPTERGEETFVVTPQDETVGDNGVEPPVRTWDASDFGNRNLFTKTFELGFMPELDEDYDYFVRFWADYADSEATDGYVWVEDGAWSASSDSTLTADVQLPYGTELSDIEWGVFFGGERIVLQEVDDPETLDEDLTNVFTYDAEVEGDKFDDVDGDGVWDEDEPPIPAEEGQDGFVIHLFRWMEPRLTDEISFQRSGEYWQLVDEFETVAPDGSFIFEGVLPGTYYVQEVQKPDWYQTAGAPTVLDDGDTSPSPLSLADTIDIEDGDREDVAQYAGDFGNRQPIKTFELSGDLPAGYDYYVDYSYYFESETTTDTVTGTLALDPVDGAYAADLTVPYGALLTSAVWWVDFEGERVVLGESDLGEGELIEEDMTNTFDYESYVFGHKFEDLDSDGTWDASPIDGEEGIEDWVIYLYRQDDEGAWVLYDTIFTDADGMYEFTEVLPGTYYLAEQLRDGWTQTAGPDEVGEGSFLVSDETTAGPVDFGNVVFLPFTETDVAIEKVADPVEAGPGDLVTYTLTYTNTTTDTPAYAITITDDYDERYMTLEDTGGGVESDGVIVWTDPGPLAPGESRQVSYTMRIDDPMPEGTTVMPNVVVIRCADDGDDSNDTDDASVSVTVEPFLPFTEEEESEPFLPFTGGDAMLLLAAAAGAFGTGLALRRRGRRTGADV